MVDAQSNTTNNANNANNANNSSGSSSTEMVFIIISSVIGIACYIASFVYMSYFIGNKDDWIQINPQIKKILLITLVGTFGLAVGAILYYIHNSKNTIYFILVLTSLSIGLSYSALAVSAIKRQGKTDK